MSTFRNRAQAGRLLARALGHYAHRPDVLVLALPPGGVPVAHEIAAAIHAPLDVFVVRPLGSPRREDVVMGAVAPGDVRLLEPHIVTQLMLDKTSIEWISAREARERSGLEQRYRGERPPLHLRGLTAILVDDGLASTVVWRAAVVALKRQQPTRLVLASPTLATATCDALSTQVDEIVCATTPAPFFAAGGRYAEDEGITDEAAIRQVEEVHRLTAYPSL